VRDDVATHRRLLDAIQAEPRDAAARAVYADWLEQRGDPRAGFFRMPHDMEAIGSRWDEHAGKMITGFQIRSYSHTVTGIPTIAHVQAAGFIERGDELLDTFPSLDDVIFELADRAEATPLAATPALARLPAIGFHGFGKGKLGNPGLAAFMKSPHLAGVSSLTFYRSDIGVSGIHALGTASLSALRELCFEENVLHGKGIAALVKTPLALAELRFRNAKLDDAAVAALAGWPGLATVRVLSIRNDATVGDAALVALANSPHVGALVELDVGGAGFGEDGARAIVESPRLARLARFELTTNPSLTRVRDVGLRRALTERFGTYWSQ
jgi:uncharacterized protein (TIGR02996 family)